jgi:hypothetical protein
LAAFIYDAVSHGDEIASSREILFKEEQPKTGSSFFALSPISPEKSRLSVETSATSILISDLTGAKQHPPPPITESVDGLGSFGPKSTLNKRRRNIAAASPGRFVGSDNNGLVEAQTRGDLRGRRREWKERVLVPLSPSLLHLDAPTLDGGAPYARFVSQEAGDP